jgi:hypothetical protein
LNDIANGQFLAAKHDAGRSVYFGAFSPWSTHEQPLPSSEQAFIVFPRDSFTSCRQPAIQNGAIA